LSLLLLYPAQSPYGFSFLGGHLLSPSSLVSCISRAKVAGLRHLVKLFFLQQIHKQAPLTPTHWVGMALTQSTGDEKFSARNGIP
jgi:hypothetical protein